MNDKIYRYGNQSTTDTPSSIGFVAHRSVFLNCSFPQIEVANTNAQTDQSDVIGMSRTGLIAGKHRISRATNVAGYSWPLHFSQHAKGKTVAGRQQMEPF